jgi:hypothetical protein
MSQTVYPTTICPRTRSRKSLIINKKVDSSLPGLVFSMPQRRHDLVRNGGGFTKKVCASGWFYLVEGGWFNWFIFVEDPFIF